MPPKRKRPTPPEASPMPDGPRRSSRYRKDDSEPGVTGRNGGRIAIKDFADGEQHDPSKKQSGIWASREDMKKAMRDLGDLEQRFQNSVRSQRLKVETSDIVSDMERIPNEGLQSNSEWQRRSTINDIIDQKPPSVLERAPFSDTDAERSIGDVAEARVDNEAEATSRGPDRPPAVNSDILPLPWNGRLGYACLNTYLRNANPPVFCSRTCRISSIIEHRHPLKDPSLPEHSTKNRPDKGQPADDARGMKFVQGLGLANARDIPKMLRWNDKYGIKFMRLSSEMFPFASHEEYGYKLAPFASGVLEAAGKIAAELGHRLTTHPGQFTQIASPRKEVVKASFRDLDYHDEMLSLLKLPEQANRDAVMILHMGGTYGDKSATLDRFRENYAKLPQGVKNRLVLENDDVAWSVHDLLPICEELNIPLVLDFHHHNIIFDQSMREGTKDILTLFDRIEQTWKRKRIRQKMHYSEPTAGAVTPRDRRKHSPRVKVLPPCGNDMDLMIEAKDKEQAVFELMRTYKLPGWDLFNDIIPNEREDAPKKPPPAKKTKKPKKGLASAKETSSGLGEIGQAIRGGEGAFMDWFRALPGATFSDAIAIVDLRDRGAGRGIIALQEIEPDTTLFTIPRRSIINAATSELPQKLPKVFEVNDDASENGGAAPLDSWSSLILILIYEYLKGEESQWKPYFDVLPETFHTPMFWSDVELSELQASPARGKIGKQEAEQMFQSTILPIIRANPDMFVSSQRLTDEHLIALSHRMGSTIMAYAFDLENDDDKEDDEEDGWVEDRDGKSMMGMVPMADMLNADAEFNAHVNHEEDYLTVTALRTIKPGQEVLNYYGPHPNSELVRRYGYATENHARYDVVEIPWTVVEGVILNHISASPEVVQKAHQKMDEADELEEVFILEWESGEPNPDGTLPGPPRLTELPQDLSHQLKTFLKQMAKIDPRCLPTKRKREESQMGILRDTLQALELRYSTSAAQDEHYLATIEMPNYMRGALMARLGEKRLLRAAKELLASAERSEEVSDKESSVPKRSKAA
ncbi:SET domain protein [Stachybotrys elegans]|uniref:SET domain protein n=1 Tax=Stachybotrys elegans TaxID=80388 RepID=A0A8K0SQU3_9HYPO|nr:SET domain protein [Stachybotrys elegans]